MDFWKVCGEISDILQAFEGLYGSVNSFNENSDNEKANDHRKKT